MNSPQLNLWYLWAGSFDDLLTVTVQYFLDFTDFLYPQHFPAWLSIEIICKEKIIDNWEVALNFNRQIKAHAPRALYLALTKPGSDGF